MPHASSLAVYLNVASSLCPTRKGRAWVVLGESVIDSRYEALRRGQVTLVNRTEELELLLRRWEQARGGGGRVVLLTGEPGIGKSRLVAALEQYATAGRHLCLRFLCSPHHLDTPLYPIFERLSCSRSAASVCSQR